jgi:hypothetical protein
MGAAAIPIAISAASTLFSIGAQQSQAKRQQAMYDRQAQVTTTENALQAEDRQRRLATQISKQRALYGASGVEIDGSPADVIEDTAGKFAREQYNADFNAETKIGSYQVSGDNAQADANAKSVGTLFNFASTTAKRG